MPSFRRIPAFLAAAVLGTSALLVPATLASAASYGDSVVINEIESSGPGNDWVELHNPTDAAIDISNWIVQDDKDRIGNDAFVFPAGTVIEPGAYLVIEESKDFTFGLGKADSVRLYDQAQQAVDEYSWSAHAPVTYGRNAEGVWGETAQETPGAANVFELPAQPGEVVLNEIDSGPADWVELYNKGDQPVSLDGYELRDNSDDHRWMFPAGTTIEPGEFLVVDAKSPGMIWDQATNAYVNGTFEGAIGIGSADSMRLYNAVGEKIDEHSWVGHANIDGDEASATLARCPDGTGAFKLARVTMGAANECVAPKVVINEIESNGDTVNGDWAEIKNIGTEPVDISGWYLLDNDPTGHASDVTPVAEGTVLEPGAYFVFAENKQFSFGLGKDDLVSIRDADGVVVAEHGWTEHAAGVLARCPDGTGEFRDVEVSTIGARNACGNPVVLSEIESKDGEPGDWIELYNPLDTDLEVGGLVVKDNDDSHAYTIPEGTVIAAGGYLVLEEADFGFGLGGADSVRIFEDDELVQEYSWTEHAPTTYALCSGSWGVSQRATKGEANLCVGEIEAQPWPGNDDVRAVDGDPMFLEDTSGLDTFGDNQLYVVDNGTGKFWLMDAQADGSLKFAAGWEDGKRVRFQKDADNPDAAGPDAEGISVDGAGNVYIGVERDNSDKGTNFNAILMVDPNKPGPDLAAEKEWNLTEVLPAVSANTGIEAVEWVSNDDLNGKLWDQNTGKPYDASQYATWADGLFFVGVENNGLVYAVALAEDGSATIVNVLDPKLGGVMALDYDTIDNKLWAVCDNGCDGKHAVFELNGTEAPALAHFERAASMPNVNNEGFALSPVCADGARFAWYAEDGVKSNAVRVVSLPCTVPPAEPGEPEQPGEQPGGTEQPGEQPGGTEQPGDDAEPGKQAPGAAEEGDDAAGLAATGAQNMTWVLWVAGALVVAGIALFALRRRGGAESDGADVDADDAIAGGAAGATDGDAPEGDSPVDNN